MRSQVFSIDQTYLQCISCNHKTDLLTEVKFRCPSCGSLYDVEHRRDTSTPMYRQIGIFNERANSIGTAKGQDPKKHSGVWRFKEWIMPYLPNEYIVTLGEGNVPIVPAGKHLQDWIGSDIDLHIILEGLSPTGSFKDFGGTVMISVAKARGVSAIGCASTGDTSAMAAAYAAAAGITCFVILPKGYVTAAQLIQPLIHGAKVITLPGDFDDCMRVMQLLVKNYGVFPANSLNPSRIEGHQATVFLTLQHFGWRSPDWFAVPVGNGSNASSIGKALRLLQQQDPTGTNVQGATQTKILGCQSQAANPLTKSWQAASLTPTVINDSSLHTWQSHYQPIPVGETAATAARIGDPVSKNKVMREIIQSNGAMQIASEKNLNQAVEICGKDGFFVCPQTGVALSGVKNAVQKGWIKKGERIVVVSTATGLKFTESATHSLKDTIIEAKNCEADTVANIINR